MTGKGLYRSALLLLPIAALARPARAGSPILWPADVPVTTAAGEQGLPLYGFLAGVSMVPDGSGGALLAWVDRASGRIRAQHLDATGRALWSPGGIQVTPFGQFQSDPQVAADGSGGLIVAYLVDVVSTPIPHADIFAQRLDGFGRALWPAAGVPVTTLPMNQGLSGIAIAADGSGGAMLAWEDAFPRCCRIVGQRLTADGTPAWAVNGLPLSPPIILNAGPIPGAPAMVSDQAGGAILGFVDQQVEPATIRLERVSPAGQLLWPGGVSLGPYGFPPYFALDSDGQGGVIAAWSKYGDINVNWFDIRAQRVGPAGQLLWPAGGVVVTDVPLIQSNPQVVSDGAGAAIIAWEDDRNLPPNGGGDCQGGAASCDIYAQRIDPSGQPSWTANGVAISVAAGPQVSPRAIADGSGGAVIAWQDCRGIPGNDECAAGMDLYAQHVAEDGTTLGTADGVPVSVAPGNQGVRLSSYRASFAMVGNAARGALLAWPDGRNGPCGGECDVYAQRVIIDPEPLPRAFAGDAITPEDSGPAIFQLTLSYPPSATVTLDYATADGTATAGVDYMAQAGSLAFPPGIDSRPILVPLVADVIDEPDETMSVVLSNPAGATLGDPSGAGLILDDDAAPSVSVGDCAVLEGNAGTSSCLFGVSLSAPSSHAVTVSYATADGSATAGRDYGAASGALTFASGETAQEVAVSVMGDAAVETDETVLMSLSNATNATIGHSPAIGFIIDDDAPPLAREELIHGSERTADLAAQPGPVADVDYYRIRQQPRSSYEVLVDGTSADVFPLSLDRLAADGLTVLQTGAPVGAGASVSLRFRNDVPLAIENQTLRIRSGGCTTSCDATAVYRVRLYDTTSSVARFNNSGTQISVVLLQNSSDAPVAGTVWFWDIGGALAASSVFSIPPHGTLTLNTAALVPGAGGTITVSSDGRYGVLSGKAVAIEPAAGFTFDTALLPRPK